MKQNDVFTWEGEVRDNETDLQGVVNNANYFVYMAHARHKHVKELGIDFEAMYKKGFNLLLIRSEMDFKDSLKSGDEFIVTSKLVPGGRIRFGFEQEVIRKSDSKVVTKALNMAVCVSRETGRPTMPDELKAIL
jgi:acyl-CoA thioester hydrolase